MNIISKFELLQFKNAARIYLKSIEESLQLFKEETKNLKIPVFIVYQKGEEELLECAVNFLKCFEILVYANWVDEDIPENSDDITQQHIQQKLQECQKLVFVATEDALQSKWLNWILRYTKTQKNIADIAILPIREDYADYGGLSLLESYAYIQKSDVDAKTYNVQLSDGKIISVEHWLSS
ncbi:TIR domain-containing protein [Aquimarina algicola]|uniref:TIR domain-containing protein n=1 Tax=Aquimarina algicola TaxID=2589995 RepID=A0A504JDK4_9FLAO|nr:TIR domain-containing protein [Aquimarina algicola]TPN86712.1 TIR domain-containing protein [Aquimarina algicola]